jgi:hypothetical protein
MSRRQQQTAFLKALVLHGNTDERAKLEERINRAERDEQCAWRALWLVSLLAMFSCCGICYSAVLVPEFFQNSSHLAVKIFGGLGLASLICALAFLCFWAWCRSVLNRAQEECRRFIMATLEPGHRAGSKRVAAEGTLSETAETAPDAGETAIFVVPRHQSYAHLFGLRRVS